MGWGWGWGAGGNGGLFDSNLGRRNGHPNWHSDYVNAVTWSPDGSMLASGSDDATINLWDEQTGKVQLTLTDLDVAVLAQAHLDDQNMAAHALAPTPGCCRALVAPRTSHSE